MHIHINNPCKYNFEIYGPILVKITKITTKFVVKSDHTHICKMWPKWLYIYLKVLCAFDCSLQNYFNYLNIFNIARSIDYYFYSNVCYNFNIILIYQYFVLYKYKHAATLPSCPGTRLSWPVAQSKKRLHIKKLYKNHCKKKYNSNVVLT